MKKIAISFLTISITLMITLLHGCSLPQLPQDVKKFALIEARKYTGKDYFQKSYNCSGFEISDSKSLELTKANKANRIDKRWEIDIDYICCKDNNCRDKFQRLRVDSKNGKLVAKIIRDRKPYTGK